MYDNSKYALHTGSLKHKKYKVNKKIFFGINYISAIFCTLNSRFVTSLAQLPVLCPAP